jgi:hypothetical protein
MFDDQGVTTAGGSPFSPVLLEQLTTPWRVHANPTHVDVISNVPFLSAYCRSHVPAVRHARPSGMHRQLSRWPHGRRPSRIGSPTPHRSRSTPHPRDGDRLRPPTEAPSPQPPPVHSLGPVAVIMVVALFSGVRAAGLPTCSPAVEPVFSVCTGMCGAIWGGINPEEVYALVVAANGDVVTAGYSLNYDDPGWYGFFDLFVLRLDGTNGSVVWSRKWGSTTEEYGHAVALAANGDVLVTGDSKGLGTTNSKADVVVLRLDGTNGGVLWSRSWGGLDIDTGSGIAVAASGDVYVTGSTASFGVGANDVFVLRLNGASGSTVWSQTWGGPSNDVAAALTVAGNGDLIVAGYTTSFGAVSSDVLVLRLSGVNGTVVWSRTWGGTFDDRGTEVAMGPTGNVFVVGYTNISVSTGLDSLVLCLDGATGAVVWARSWGGNGPDPVNSVVVAANGDVVAVGTSNSSSSLQGRIGGLVLRLNGTSGNLMGATTLGAAAGDNLNAVAVTARGVVAAGSTLSFGVRKALVLPVFDDGSAGALPALGSSWKSESPTGTVFRVLNTTMVPVVGNMTSPTVLAAVVTGDVTSNNSAAVAASMIVPALQTNNSLPLVRHLKLGDLTCTRCAPQPRGHRHRHDLAGRTLF